MENKYSDELYHHGIKGQKWGIRRWQRLDGTLTPAGVERYGHAPEFVKENRLRRQVLRNTTFGSNQAPTRSAMRNFKRSGKYDEYMRDAYLSESSIKKAREFVNEFAGAKLKQMGYEDTEKGRAYLASFPWFQDLVPYVGGELTISNEIQGKLSRSQRRQISSQRGGNAISDPKIINQIKQQSNY